MATAYNNLYLDAGRQLRVAGLEAAQLAARAKELLLELANISLELARTAVTPEGDGALPAWFLAEAARELPALAKKQG